MRFCPMCGHSRRPSAFGAGSRRYTECDVCRAEEALVRSAGRLSAALLRRASDDVFVTAGSARPLDNQQRASGER